MGQERVEGYAEGFRVGWDKAVESIQKRISKDDVFNSHVSFAWNKVLETLNSDDIKQESEEQ